MISVSMFIRRICKHFYHKIIGFGNRVFIEELGSIYSAVIFSNYCNFLCNIQSNSSMSLFCLGLSVLGTYPI